MTILQLGRTAPSVKSLRVPIVLLLSPLLIAVVVLAVVHAAYGERILPGVSVGLVDVGGLSRDAARDRLIESYSYLGDDLVVLTGAETPVRLAAVDVERRLDVDAALDSAFAVGRGSDPLATTTATLQLALDGGRSVAPEVSIDPGSLRRLVAGLGASLDVAPGDARVDVASDDFRVVAASSGRRLDQASLVAALEPALLNPDPVATPIGMSFSDVPPTTPTAIAEQAVAVAKRFSSVPLSMTAGGHEWTVEPTVAQTWIGFSADSGTITPILLREPVEAWLQGAAADVDRSARDASFRWRDGRIVVVAAKSGRRLDVDASVGLIDGLLARVIGGDHRPDALPLKLASTSPDLATAEAKAIAGRMRRISHWTTRFVPSERNGFGANIRVPARTINGTVVMPGEVFDYWQAVGEVSRRTGFRQGAAIINGRTEPQGAFAGGICTSSTTLFNAAARAGYEILERRAHFYYIDRYPLGLDATVFKSDGGATQSMSFRNDTKYPLLVRGLAGQTWTRFEIWSVPTGRTVTFSRARMSNHREATSSVEYDASRPVGYAKVLEVPTDGMNVTVTRTVRDRSGEVIHRDTWFSRYRRVDGLTIRGGSRP